MKICNKCGKNYDDSWNVCLSCTTPLSNVEAALTEEQKIAKEDFNKKEADHTCCATMGRRVADMFIDGFLSSTIAQLIAIPFFSPFISPDKAPPDRFSIINILAALVVTSLLFLYYFIFEVTLNRTPAKYITRIKVVMDDGTKPKAKAIFIRTLCRFIPFEMLSFLSHSKPIGWHDRFSKTRVIIDKKDAPAPKRPKEVPSTT